MIPSSQLLGQSLTVWWIPSISRAPTVLPPRSLFLWNLVQQVTLLQLPVLNYQHLGGNTTSQWSLLATTSGVLSKLWGCKHVSSADIDWSFQHFVADVL